MADGKTPYISAANQQYYVVASSGYVVDTRTNAPFLTSSNDLSVLGHAYPNFTSSLINSVTLFKTLTISFQFDWVHGNSIYNLTKQWLYTPAGGAGGSGANSGQGRVDWLCRVERPLLELVGNDLGVTDGHGLRGRIDRLGR